MADWRWRIDTPMSWRAFFTELRRRFLRPSRAVVAVGSLWEPDRLDGPSTEPPRLTSYAMETAAGKVRLSSAARRMIRSRSSSATRSPLDILMAWPDGQGAVPGHAW